MVVEIIIFAFLAMLCWGFGDFLIQKTTRKIGDIEALAYIGIFGAIVLIPFMIKDFKLLFSFSNLLIMLILGILTFFIAILDFEALKKGKISIIDVIIELELPVTIILGFIFFKEYLSIYQFLVIGLIFIGIVMVATKSNKTWKIKLEKGIVIAILAAIGFGFINFLTAVSSKQVSPIMAIWVPWLIVSVLCLVYIPRREGYKKFIKNGLKFKWLVLFMGLFDTAAWLFYAMAVFNGEVSIITAITESYPAIALFLGVYFNKEKINWHQYFGAGLAILASIILAMSV